MKGETRNSGRVIPSACVHNGRDRTRSDLWSACHEADSLIVMNRCEEADIWGWIAAGFQTSPTGSPAMMKREEGVRTSLSNCATEDTIPERTGESEDYFRPDAIICFSCPQVSLSLLGRSRRL